MAQFGPSVAIVGGGIGGLFAANALVSHGLRVAVYEQAPAIGEVGAGVFLTPNGLRYDSAYADLGVRDFEIAAHAAFRRRLYDHDVVPQAQAAAASLN
jgi:2-polyprenyl-6-methoxyphenol hydroxylase-like FAD-dependent oxidoreductase